LTAGAGGVDRTTKRRQAHCKFIGCPGQSILFKIRQFKIAARPQNGAPRLKSRMHSRKIDAGFQPVSPLSRDK
jgi:hypothetical protein